LLHRVIVGSEIHPPSGNQIVVTVKRVDGVTAGNFSEIHG
jgi:hypothetical protein